MAVNDVWDVYISSYIVDLNGNIWSGPQAISLPLQIPIHVITACNPHEEKLSTQDNHSLNQTLQQQLSIRNVQYEFVIGCSSDMDWQEASFAIFGLQRNEACQLGSAFQQRGIFELTNSEMLALDCTNGNIQRRRARNLC